MYMSLVPQEVLNATVPTTSNKSSEGAKAGATSAGETAYSIRQNRLLNKVGPGLDRETGNVENMVGIPRVVHEQMVEQMGSHLQRLLDFKNNNPVSFYKLMALEAHQAESTLLDRAITNDQIDYDKLGKLLKEEGKGDGERTGIGWKVAMTAMEQVMTQQFYALGLSGVLRKGYGRGEKDSGARRKHGTQDIEVSLNIDDGWIRNLFKNTNVKGLAGMAGSMAAGGGIGALGAKLAGAASVLPFGIGGALVPPAVYGIYRGLRKGYHVDQKAFAQGLNMMQGQEDREFMVRAYGIDPGNFRVDNGNVVAEDTARYSSEQVSEVQKQLGDMVLLRLMTYQSWGVDLQNLDALPEQSFFTYAGDPDKVISRMEQNRSDHAHRINVRLRELVNGHPGGVMAANEAQLLRYKNQARIEVMGELVQELIKSEGPSKAEQRTGDMTLLGTVKTALQYDTDNIEESGEAAKKVSEEARERSAQLTTENKTLEASQRNITTVIEAENKRSQLLVEISKRFGNGKKFKSLAEVDVEIGRRNGLSKEKLTDLREKLATAEAAYDEQKAKGEQIDDFFDSCSQAYDTFVGVGLGQFGLSHDFLARSSLDTVLAKINQTYRVDSAVAVGPKRGWPSQENRDHRMQVLRVIAEAKAREREPLVGNSPLLDHVVGYLRLSSNDLRSMTPAELTLLGGAIPAGAGRLAGRLTNDESRTLLIQANSIFSERVRAWKEVVDLEKTWTVDHNENIESRLTNTNNQIQHLTSEHGKMTQAISEINEYRDVRKVNVVVEEVLKGNPEVYWEGVRKIEAIVTATDGTAYDLSPTSIQGMTFSQVMDRINQASANGVTGAWSNAVNADPENIMSVISYISEAQAKQNNKIANIDPELQTVLSSAFVNGNEAVLYNARSASSISKLINKNLNPVDRISDAVINRAITESRERFEIRKQALVGMLTQSMVNGFGVEQQIRAGNLHPPNESAKFATNAHLLFLSHSDELRTKYNQANAKLIEQNRRIGTELGLGRPATIGDVEVKLMTLTEEKNNLQKYNNEAETSLKTELDRISEYDTALSKLTAARREVGSTYGIDGDKVTTAELDKLVETHAANPIKALTDLRDELKKADEGIAVTSESAKTLRTEFATGIKVYGDITVGIDAALAAAGGVRLQEADLINEPLHEILSRINQAHGIPPNAVGWPEEENDQHKTEVMRAVVEARLRNENPHLIVAHVEFDQVTSPGLGLSEQDLLTLTPDQIKDKLTDAAARGVAGAAAAANLNIIGKAMKEAGRRFQVRTHAESVQNTIDANTRHIADQDTEAKTAVETLKDKRIFVETVVQLAGRQDTEIFPWVRSWAGPRGMARENQSYHPIRPTDETFTEAERFSGPAGARVRRILPGSYYALLNAMTGYQKLDADKRAERFEELVDHPQFSPDAIAEKMNTMLSLNLGTVGRPPLNLRNVFIMTQVALDGNRAAGIPRSMSPMQVHDGFEALIQDYVDRAKVMK